MTIIEEFLGENLLEISNSNETARLIFNPNTKVLKFLSKNKLTRFLKDNEYQLRKVMHNKRKNTYYEGFNLIISLISEKDVAAFNDKENIVVLDKREEEVKCYVLKESSENIYKIYTDGCFLELKGKGAYAGIIQTPQNEYKLYGYTVKEQNNNLIEMMAAIKGIDILQHQSKLRIITDSQYVRKGLTEWIHYWKVNDWITANGEDVKHIDYWKKFDKITEGKYIEFEWVKGHSNQFENELCDMYAKEIAKL